MTLHKKTSRTKDFRMTADRMKTQTVAHLLASSARRVRSGIAVAALGTIVAASSTARAQEPAPAPMPPSDPAAPLPAPPPPMASPLVLEPAAPPVVVVTPPPPPP